MINPLRKQKIEIDEAPVFKPSVEEAGKTWAIEARGITKSFKAFQKLQVFPVWTELFAGYGFGDADTINAGR